MESINLEPSRRPFLAEKPVFSQILIFSGLLLFSLSVFTLISAALLKPFFGVSLSSLQDLPGLLSNHDLAEEINLIRSLEFLQIAQAIGLFIVPVLVMALLMDNKPFNYLQIAKQTSLPTLVAVIVIMIASEPLINRLVILNEKMTLPQSFHLIEEWMKDQEGQAKIITDLFLDMKSKQDFVIVFFMVAILPAIGEELLFRGVIQRLFSDGTKNVHLGIFISAFLFSALHMQFYGFLPRLLLGMLFGYLLYWSGSLWLPMLGHFINNGSAVLFAYLTKLGKLSFDPDKIGTEENNYVLLFICSAIVAVLLFRISKQKSPSDFSERD